ncbi:MAG TPA: phosphopantetheine-binding protein [Thermoanaerobaculia bacterium]|jgi:acyl carrier protein|nr:phosphopantetheine-binding protein [Thermoanaerobaculia bacterium]
MTPTPFERVQSVLSKKYSLALDAITPESTLESLGLDSLDLIELLFDVEDEFGIRIPQDGGSALKTATIQDIIDSVQKLVPEAPATVVAHD